MAKIVNVTTSQLREIIPTLQAGDKVLLSGTVYTSRDAAHKRINSLIDEDRKSVV